RGSDQEFVVLRNLTEQEIDLGGWLVGDAATPGSGEGMYVLPDGLTIAPAGRVILARNAAGFVADYVLRPDAEFEESAAEVPSLSRRRDLATGQFALKDGGDEVLLLTPAGQLVDAVAYGTGDGVALGLTGTLDASGGDSLQRVDGVPPQADQRHRFAYAPPDPFRSIFLPDARAVTRPHLADGLMAAWGTLGATSNFSPDGSAPPHYVLAHAAAAGLDFVALADAAPTTPWVTPPGVVHLPAWRWEDGDQAAIIYDNLLRSFADATALANFAAAARLPVQWLDDPPAGAAGLTAVDGQTVDVPARLPQLAATWTAAGAPLLPAGNSPPPMPGRVDAAPRFTGLATSALTPEALSAALAARRGWLTNSPGLWLALRTDDGAAGSTWMGGTIPAANTVTLDIQYGDITGEPAGLALWQDGRPIRQLDLPPVDGRWTVTVPAVPGTFVYAVATQADGGFAVTTPLYVTAEHRARRCISRVVPVPGADYNGDGALTADDEFIELVNPGSVPVSLAGWQLSDSRGDETPSRRFTFGAGRFLAGGQRLQLFRNETRLNLNNAADSVRLLDPDGNEIDVVRWAEAPAPGVVFEQDPADGQWRTGVIDQAPPPWSGPAVVQSGTPQEPEDVWEKWAEGQAAGSPGSVAMAKRRGLYIWTEFEGVVIAPPGLFNTAIYVADVAADGSTAAIGVQVYLRNGAYPELAEGDRVRVRGETSSFRGEMEMFLESPEQIWRVESGPPLAPLHVTPAEIGESLEGRFVTFEGVVTGWQGDSIYLGDPADPDAAPVRVTVRSTLDWRRPYVNEGERFRVTGIVGQFASTAPWNDGYRVLVRYPSDLLELNAEATN
ncbi:MAG: lamin tail domain-containing protein, partial [Caldilineaceae bacterium]